MSDPRRVSSSSPGSEAWARPIARRIGSGSTVIVADSDERLLEEQVGVLTAAGHDVVGHVVDVSHQGSVEALAGEAAARGPVTALVHTAGLSPVQAPVDAILRVDLVGYGADARRLRRRDGLRRSGCVHLVDGGNDGIPGSRVRAPPGLHPDRAPGSSWTSFPGGIADPATAYVVAKRANQIRVRAAARRLGTAGGTGELHLPRRHLHGDGRLGTGGTRAGSRCGR